MKIKSLLFFIFPVMSLFPVLPTTAIYRNFFNDDHDLDDDNITSILQRYVGVHEKHQVSTEDGYILEIFRIPRKDPKGVILLQHPILFDARIWVGQYNESIAFVFWRAGYDVWLGNTRGNYFCKKHIRLTPRDPEFWDFSFHEMGYYDNPAIVEYIRKVVNQRKIIYLGYSMGATSGLVYATTRPDEVADAIKLMIVLAPVTHLLRGTSIAKYIVPPFYRLQRKLNLVDLRSTILEHDIWYLRIFRFLFRNPFLQKCLLYLIRVIAGWTDELDPNLMNILVKTFGSEVPFKLGDHFNQIYIHGGKFQRYDYGGAENLKLYGNRTPPDYPLKNIKVPVYIVYGQNDSFICTEDIDELYKELPKESKIYGRLLAEGLNHADFGHGRHRNERVYLKILKLLERIAQCQQDGATDLVC